MAGITKYDCGTISNATMFKLSIAEIRQMVLKLLGGKIYTCARIHDEL
jgi:hypothetical protein